MSWFFYLVLSFPVICYLVWTWLKWKFRKWEDYMYSRAPPLNVTHKQMVDMANKVPRDNKLTDEEFDVKYGPFRHEIFRGFTMKKRSREILNDVLHYAELYIRHGGPKNLAKSQKIIKPIFIIGDFRSGTSVLERIVFHHPDVQGLNFGHMLMWKAPYYWDSLYDLFQKNRQNAGHPCWYGRGCKGLYSPHSSNNLLVRANPWENEVIWSSCKQNLFKNRDYKWDTLDDPKKCKDNTGSPDILTEEFDDPGFEKVLKNAIRMLLKAYNGKRFINKNPLNGYRVGYLKKMFPDAKFIHIRRNPIKTCQSQILMNETFGRIMYINDPEWRRAGLRPKPLSKEERRKCKNTTKHWSYITSGHTPNEFISQTWMPRVWPRTEPYQYQINQHIKQDKIKCAAAVGVCQHEDAAMKAYERLGFKSGKDILYIWHEDVIEDATLAATKVFQFLELDVTKEQILEYLEAEGFPNGQAAPRRVNFSKQKNDKPFGDETEECLKILEPVLKEFKKRRSIKEKWGMEDTKIEQRPTQNGITH